MRDRDVEEKLAQARELRAIQRASVANLEAQLALLQEKLNLEKTRLAEAEATVESLETRVEQSPEERTATGDTARQPKGRRSPKHAKK